MIAAEPQRLRGETDARGDIADEALEVRRPHPGVAAELIHLVRSRFDEQRRVRRLRLAQRAFHDLRVRRAQRIHPDTLALLVPRHDVE
jgi:hypothetical protein